MWQILGSYAVGAWLILQLAETLAGLVGLPLWFGPTVVTLVLLGFPLILVTSLVQGGGGPGHFALGDGAGSDGPAGEPLPSAGRAPWPSLFAGVFTWRNTAGVAASVAVLLGLGTAGYIGMRTAGLGPVGSLLAKGVFVAEERIVLAQFEDRTPDGTLGETVSALFRIALAQSPAIVLLDRVQLQPALNRMQRDPIAPLDESTALEVAQREGVKAIVAGEVLPLGDGAVVVARLVEASGGATLVALRETARRVEEVPEAVDRLSARLRERVGESLRSIQGDPPLQEVTTMSLQALRRYAQAEHANDMGDWEGAERLLSEAVAEDSTFAMAWRKLGILLQNANREPDRAREAFTRAFDGRGRLTERERYLAEAAYHTYVTGDEDAAVRQYERLLEQYPTDRIALNNLAIVYGRSRIQDALRLYLRSIRSGMAPAVTYGNAVTTFFELGQADSAAVMLEAFRAAYPENLNTLSLAATLAAAQFDYDTAEVYSRRLIEQGGSPRWQVVGLLSLAGVALVHGRPNEAWELGLRVFDLQDAGGIQNLPQPRPIFEGLGLGQVALYFSEDPQGAVAWLNRGLAALPIEGVAPENLDHAGYAEVFARAGRPDLARERLRAYESEVPADVQAEPGRRAAVLSARAAIALAEGTPEEALSLLSDARALAEDCPLCFLPELGEAYERLARPDSTVAVLERYLETPVLERLGQDGFNLPRVLLTLGRAREALGQPSEAATYYRRVVELWSDAEPELRPRVERVRAKLMSLESGT